MGWAMAAALSVPTAVQFPGAAQLTAEKPLTPEALSSFGAPHVPLLSLA